MEKDLVMKVTKEIEKLENVRKKISENQSKVNEMFDFRVREEEV
jgi:hypothetical protein